MSSSLDDPWFESEDSNALGDESSDVSADALGDDEVAGDKIAGYDVGPATEQSREVSPQPQLRRSSRRRGGGSRPTLSDWTVLWIGAAALATSVLVVGGAMRWTQVLVAGLVALAMIIHLTSRRAPLKMSPVVLFLGAATVITAFQLVPLPHGLLSMLDGQGMELRDGGAQLAGTSPWPCISMDPPGTLRALTFFLTLLGVATLCARFAASERGKYLLVAAVVLTCGAAAMVTGLHVLLSADSLYGIYDLHHATPPILGPLLNTNHLGCLMAFGMSLAIGLVFYQSQATQLRVLWLVIAIGCALVVLGSTSRGAAIGLVLGASITGTLLFARRASSSGSEASKTLRRRRAVSRDLPIAIVVGISLTVALVTSAGKVVDQLENTSLSELNHPLSKFEAWKSSMSLVEEAPWFGIGRGAIEPSLTRVHPASSFATFSHLENEYVSGVVEWGIPASVIMALLLAACVVAAARRWRDGPLAAGAFGAMSAVMFQSSVDFGIEMLGVAVPVTIIAATLVPVSLRQATSKTKLARAGLITALVVSGALLATGIGRSIEEDHDDLSSDDGATLADFHDEIQRHPIDYFGFAKTADLMLSIGDKHAVDFLNYALILHPTHAGLHRLAARMLVMDRRPEQAAIEYSLALHGTAMPKPVLIEILGTLPDASLAARAIPPDWEPKEAILTSLKELHREDVVVAWLSRVIQSPDADIQTIDDLYHLAMNRGDLEAAYRAAQRRLELAHTFSSRLMLARVEVLRKDYAPVLADLADVASWHTRVDEQSEAWMLLCDSFSAQNDLDHALQCLHRLDGAGIVPLDKRLELSRRIQLISDRHSGELKLRAVDDAMHEQLPALPTVHSDAPASPTGHDAPPAQAIDNPLAHSPLRN